MKVDYIKTIGFRKFKGVFETKLFDTTNITGKNRSGKSNILYAIVNIMLGTNLSGDEKSCLIHRKCDASYGELHFTDNQGIKHILVRGKNKVGTKNNFLTLDGKPVTQNELISFYKDKKLFLSIINPLYFLSKKPAEQKEMVDKYLSDIKPFEIFNKLSDLQKQNLLKRYFKIHVREIYDKFTEEERNSGLTNIVMGLSFITEGAIPFGAADPARAIPSFIVGSALTGALVGMAGIKLMAPHGGIFVIALTSNALLYLLFILIGAVVSGILFGFLRKPLDK